MEINSALGRADGIREEDLAALPNCSGHSAFTAREQAALAYAECIATGNTIPDDLFARVRIHFNEDEIVELTAIIVWEIAAAKFNRALHIEGQGICLLPQRS